MKKTFLSIITFFNGTVVTYYSAHYTKQPHRVLPVMIRMFFCACLSAGGRNYPGQGSSAAGMHGMR